jgi:hypothetical protein
MKPYDALQQRLACGWNTWNTRSVLSHVLLPAGLAYNLGLKEYAGGRHLREALIGRFGADDEQIIPGARTYDGAYTGLTLAWRGLEVRVESAIDGDDLLLLVTPLKNQVKPAALTVETGFLWNRPGSVERVGNTLAAKQAGHEYRLTSTGEMVEDPAVNTLGPYLALALTQPVALFTGRTRSLEEVQSFLMRRETDVALSVQQRYGDLAEVYSATQTCLAWDTIYEPTKNRAISTVSRLWNLTWGGYVIFDWDTYFAGLMAGLDNRDLAYANAVEITRAKTARGFIPNFEGGTGKSEDRSQPPVGSLVVSALYRRYGERWLVEEVFDDLLEWNRWWMGHRRCPCHRQVLEKSQANLLAWGSDPYQPVYGAHWETSGVNDRLGAALESGLDNSPMYDDIPFDADAHVLALADVGLTALYVMDCDALAELAEAIGRAAEADELRARAEDYRAGLATLWDEETGIFRNRRTDTGEFSARLSPTNFYPLLARAASPEQAGRMIREHFYNPDEFWGEWMLPSIARSDPAYPEQAYWRGRVWAPMNLLVYLGLKRSGLAQAAADLAEKSRALILKEWREHGHVHENYNANTGEGCDIHSSDKFYHWGGLLGLVALMEAGFMEA